MGRTNYIDQRKRKVYETKAFFFFKRRLVDRVKSFVIILSEPLKLNYRRKSKRERERLIKVKIYNTFDSGIARLFSSIQFSHSVMSNSL